MSGITGVKCASYKELAQRSPVVYHLKTSYLDRTVVVHASYLVKKLNGKREPAITVDKCGWLHWF